MVKIITLLLFIGLTFGSSFLHAQSIDETLQQIDSLKKKIIQKEKLVKEKIFYLKQTDPLFADQDAFENDADFINRLFEAEFVANFILRSATEDLKRELELLLHQRITVEIELDFNKRLYDANTSVWKILGRVNDQYFEDRINIEGKDAQYIYKNKNNLEISGSANISYDGKIILKSIQVQDSLADVSFPPFSLISKERDAPSKFRAEDKCENCEKRVKRFRNQLSAEISSWSYDSSKDRIYLGTRRTTRDHGYSGELAVIDQNKLTILVQKVPVTDIIKLNHHDILLFSTKYNRPYYSQQFFGGVYLNYAAKVYEIFGSPVDSITINENLDLSVYNGGSASKIPLLKDSNMLLAKYEYLISHNFEKYLLDKSSKSVDKIASIPSLQADLALNTQFTEPSGNNALDADEKATINSEKYLLDKSSKSVDKIASIPSLPADLALDIQFTEPSGNNALDADEKATIILNITNNGMGEAYEVMPQINLISSISDLTIGDFEAIDKILPNTTVEAKISISAGRKILSQNIELEIHVTEHNGFDLYPAGLLRIQAKALLPPKLVLADVGIDDLTNSNGRIDPNEIIEATAIIHNIGQGIAENVNVDVNYGENIFKAGDSKTSFSVGSMRPNETKQISFQFFAKREAQENLPINLHITEKYGEYGLNKSAGLSLNKEFKKSTEVIIVAKENKLVEITSVDSISVDIEQNIPKTEMNNRDAMAVVIGNREYAGDIPDADFALRDAQFVKEYLIKTMGYRTGNIYYYDNATKAQMGIAFKKLKNAVKPNRSDVFVYYSGHGAPDPDSKQGYFVPVDADPNFIKESGYPVSELYEILKQTDARSTMVVIDACFSGSSDGGKILKDISPVFIEVDNSFLNLRNSALFTSSTGEQVSSWYRDKSHSLFTYYFLKGLQGEADLDSDSTLILSELKEYIDDKVPYMARRINNRKQNPQLTTDDDTKVVVTY